MILLWLREKYGYTKEELEKLDSTTIQLAINKLYIDMNNNLTNKTF